MLAPRRAGGVCRVCFHSHCLAPATHDPDSGVYVYRNVFDQRAGVYYGLPSEDDPCGAFLHHEGHLIGDHGSPVYPVMRVYHNTFLRREAVWRDYFLFGLGAVSPRNTERDVFNNLFVQADRVPGAVVLGKEAGPLREGGNLLGGVRQGPAGTVDPFAKLRNSPLLKDSRKFYEPGWRTNDRVADPKFVKLADDPSEPSDLRLSEGSPAIDAGLVLPANWPDPLREADKGKPDIGAVPLGVTGWGVGVDGRIPVFGGTNQRAPRSARGKGVGCPDQPKGLPRACRLELTDPAASPGLAGYVLCWRARSARTSGTRFVGIAMRVVSSASNPMGKTRFYK